jgi:hypothetical protein
VRHVRMLGVCSAAAVVLSMVGTSVATAKLPEWGKCEQTEGHAGGKYADAGCTVPVKKVHGQYPGGYEWHTLENGDERHGEESAMLFRRNYSQPIPAVTITLGGGLTITCQEGRNEHFEAGEDDFYLGGTGGHTVGTPYIEFQKCADNQPGTETEKLCHTTDGGNGGEIVDETAYSDWLEKEPGAWPGSMAFIEGKDTFEPKVGLVWKTEEPRKDFFQEIACINGYTILTGGGTGKEALMAQIEPLNEMSASFTTHLSPRLSAVRGTRSVEAKVNLGEWEPIGIEATMVFTEVEPSFESINYEKKELELKATA